MATVLTGQPGSTAVAERHRGEATRKYAVELIGTFFLVFTVAVSSLSRSTFAPLAIGFTVLAGACAAGGISGGAFNPAVSLGAAAGGLFAWSTLRLYFVVQAVAGIAAGLTFLALNPDDR